MTESTQSPRITDWQAALLARHRLGRNYLSSAQEWFDPLANSIAAHHDGASGPILVAVNGSQGSGKTTLCDYLQAVLTAQYGKRALALSIDDFYLTHHERQSLAESVHPLCATRGVPGTHDISLLKTTVAQLLDPARSSDVVIPSFDKATDDRKPVKELKLWTGALDIVLLEGWCLGARPQEDQVLEQPLNALEEQEDSDGVWRRWVNCCLANDYLPLYDCVDFWVMLAAPDFDCVLAWRSEQEQKLRESLTDDSEPNALQSVEDLQRFVQHYERLTKECLATLPGQVGYLLSLDAQRNVCAVSHRLSGNP
ncbi:MAG: hypothetical protein ABJ084_15695 [Halioglobus sp.]